MATLRFNKMNETISNDINRILEIQFVQVMATSDINREIRKQGAKLTDCQKKLGELLNDKPENDGDVLKVQAEITAINDRIHAEQVKKQAISSYANPVLFGTKSRKNKVYGLYDKVLKADGTSIYEYYVDAIDRKSINDTKTGKGFNTAMRTMVSENWGLNRAKKSLIDKFIKWVVTNSVYQTATSGNKIVKGELIKVVPEKSYNKTLLMVMVDYMNTVGGADIIVPDKEHYSYEVQYDENVRTCEVFKMVKVED